jgi:hypothetical protein
MKPRTKLEKRVVALSETLKPVTEAQKRWAKKNCFDHNAYMEAGWLWCTECGKYWMDIDAKNGDKTACPYCQAKLEVKKSRKKKENVETYMTIVDRVEEFQVLRHVHVQRVRGTYNGGETWYSMMEVCQQWFSSENKELVIAKPIDRYGRSWLSRGPMTLKGEGNLWYGLTRYDINGYVYPRVKLLPQLVRNGLGKDFHDITPATLVRRLLNNEPWPEILLKNRQFSLLKHWFGRGGYIRQTWAIKICNRNHYIVKDASMWTDYIDLLDYFHLDTHNAHYVCPKNLKAEHDRLLKRKNKLEAEHRRRMMEEKKLKDMEKMKKNIHKFMEHIRPFLDLEIRDSDLVIRPLENISQFYAEGKAMHHCVYRLEYYNRPECLILSARVGGERMETLEVSLDTFEIIQSRAVCNGTSKHHDRIIRLMKENMWMIRNRAS